MTKIGIVEHIGIGMTTQVIETLQENHDVVIVNEAFELEPIMIHQLPEICYQPSIEPTFTKGSKYHK